MKPTQALDQKPAFRFAIVYENFSAGVQAVVAMEPLLAQLRAEFEVQTNLWAFEEFGHFPQLIERATLEMVEADMIVVSTESPQGLPARIQDWIERWAPHKAANPAALVALGPAGDPVGSEPAAASFLRRIAGAGKMDFFCATHPLQNAEPTVPLLGLPELQPSVHAGFALAEAMARPSAAAGWGTHD